MGMSLRFWGVAAVAVSAFGFGVMPIFARLAYQEGTDVVALLFLRFSIAALIMLTLMIVTRRKWPSLRNTGILMAMGGIGYVSQSYAFFAALKYASAGLVALLLYLYPILVAIFGALLFKEPLGTQRFSAVILAFVGTALTVWGALDGQPLGIALGALAAVLYCAYILAGSRVLASEEPYTCGTVVIITAALVFGALVVANEPRFPQTQLAWGAVIMIALLSTVVAVIGFFIGVRILGASDASTLSTLEPVVTIIAAAIFLQEVLTMPQLLGGAIILAAVIWLTRIRAAQHDRSAA